MIFTHPYQFGFIETCETLRRQGVGMTERLRPQILPRVLGGVIKLIHLPAFRLYFIRQILSKPLRHHGLDKGGPRYVPRKWNKLTSVRIQQCIVGNEKCIYTGKYVPNRVANPNGSSIHFIGEVDTQFVLIHFQSLTRFKKISANVMNHRH